MKFLKTMCLLLGVLFGSVCSVKAEIPKEMRDKISVAQQRFEQTKNVLREKNPERFFDFDSNKWTEKCYAAEKFFRKHYPDEYNDYIVARIELDDLFYTLFVSNANQIKR